MSLFTYQQTNRNYNLFDIKNPWTVLCGPWNILTRTRLLSYLLLGHNVMQTPILHRSLKSPYAQKIMLLMGYLNQSYLSFIAPKGIPRPIEEELVGEYSRRIPTLQIGADLYCDSELIMKVLAENCHVGSLYNYPSLEEAQAWIEKIEIHGNTSIFGSIKPLELVCAYFKNMPPNHAWKFISDRAKLGKTVKLPNADLPYEEKVNIAEKYLQEVDNQLSQQDFFLSDEVPTSLDFTAYTMIYYLDTVNKLKLAKGLPNLLRWYQKMSAIGTGSFNEVSGKGCLDIANNASPAPVTSQYLNSSRIGQEISYTNKGFMAQMNSGVKGIIVGEDENTIILRRETPKVGVVHVHFPKLNY